MLFSTPQVHFQSVYPSPSSFLCWNRAQSSDACCCRPLQQLYLQSTSNKPSQKKTHRKALKNHPPNLSYSCTMHRRWGVRSNQMRAWVASKIHATKSGIWATVSLNSAAVKGKCCLSRWKFSHRQGLSSDCCSRL